MRTLVNDRFNLGLWETQMERDDKFDRATFGVRFGCGFFFALLISPFAIGRFVESWTELIGYGLVFAAIFGVLAWILGDTFWKTLANWWW